MNKRHIVILSLGGIVIVAMLLILIFVPAPSEVPRTTENNEPEIETELVEIADGVVVELPKGINPEDIKLEEVREEGIRIPDLAREVNIPDVFPDDAKKVMAKNIANAITTIEADPTSFGAWLALGNLRKQIADYEGAIEVYEYLNAVAPENDVAHYNAASTYHLNLQEFEKAEDNFEKAITNNVTYVLAYMGYHDLYKFSYKQDTNRAVEVLEEGIRQTDDPNLYLALGVYYIDHNMEKEAKEALESAKKEALKDPAMNQLVSQADVLLSEL